MDANKSPLNYASLVSVSSQHDLAPLQYSFDSIAKCIETSSGEISEFIKVFESSINLWSDGNAGSLTRESRLISSLGN